MDGGGRMSSTWSGRRVLVTGATGIVGSWLTKALLAEQAYVVALVLDADHQSELYRSGDIARISVVNGALEDIRALERAVTLHDVEVVFHLGAQTLVGVAHRVPIATFETNIRGTYHVLEVARLHRQTVRGVVIASSDKAYGAHKTLPYTEEMDLAGRHPYEVSKSCADLIAQAYHYTYGLPVAMARCGNVFGGGDLNWSRLVPGTIRSLLRRERPVIRSDGTYVRDYIYVKDVAHAYIHLAVALLDGSAAGEAFNFGLEQPVTVMEMVGAIQRLMDATHLEPEIQNTAEGEIHSQYLSARKARRILGWRPSFTLESGLQETIQWYRGFLAGG